MNFTLEINFGKETLNLLSALVAKSMPPMPEVIASPSVSNGKARKVDKVADTGKEAANDFSEGVEKELQSGNDGAGLTDTGGLEDGETTTKVGTITLPDLRDKVTKKIQGGKRDQVAALLNKFNSKSVTTLEKEKYQQFLLQLEEL